MTADDYLVEGIKLCGLYDAIQAAFIGLRIMAFLLGHHFCDTVQNN